MSSGKQAEISSAMKKAMEEFDEKEMQAVLDADVHVEESETHVETDVKRMTQLAMKKILWKFTGKKGFMSPRLPYTNDGPLKAFRAMLQLKFDVAAGTAGETDMYSFLHDVLVEFHAILGPMEGRISRRDTSVLLEIHEKSDYMQRFQLPTKLKTMPAAAKEILFQYMASFAKIAKKYDVYMGIPDALFLAVRKVATDYIAMSKDGTMTADKVQPFKMGMTVLSNASKDSKLDFVERMGDIGAILNLFNGVLLIMEDEGIDMSRMFSGGVAPPADGGVA